MAYTKYHVINYILLLLLARNNSILMIYTFF